MVSLAKDHLLHYDFSSDQSFANGFYMSKNIFITGAAGFIGFHLAVQLARRGDRVLGFDNFNAYYPTQLKRARAAELKKCNIEVLEGDINDVDLLQTSIKQHNATHIVHLAAQAGVRYSLENPQTYLKTNVDGFLNILEICRQNPQLKLTYASSSSVYGRNQTLPFATSQRTEQQTSLYGVTKKTNELMAETYSHLFGLSAIGLRFFTVYGPWGRPDMAYYSFASAIVKEKPIELYNQGQMQRDFTYVDDIVSGTMAAIDYQPQGHEIFNLGNNRSVELLELVSALECCLGKKARISLSPMPAADVVATHADITESTLKLGFIPKISLAEGIAQFVAWYTQHGQLVS